MDTATAPLMGAYFDLNYFLKTGQGKELLDQHRPFIAKGEVLQGFQGRCFPVAEDQLSDDEIEAAMDIDGTKAEVWRKRQQRLGSAHLRKAQEYADRRGKLRAMQNEIFEASERRAKLGLPLSQADAEEIDDLDKRMARLSSLKESLGAEIAQAALEPPADPTQRTEAICGAVSPEHHQNPEKWRIGHQVGCTECREAKGRGK